MPLFCSKLCLLAFYLHLFKRLFSEARGKTGIPWLTCGCWLPYPEARWPYLCAPPVRPDGAESPLAWSRCLSLLHSSAVWKLSAFDSSWQQYVKECSHSKKNNNNNETHLYCKLSNCPDIYLKEIRISNQQKHEKWVLIINPNSCPIISFHPTTPKSLHKTLHSTQMQDRCTHKSPKA